MQVGCLPVPLVDGPEYLQWGDVLNTRQKQEIDSYTEVLLVHPEAF